MGSSASLSAAGRLVGMEERRESRARRLCHEHAWLDACHEFAASSDEPDAADLEAWAEAAYLVGDVEIADVRWAAAHDAWLEAGEVGRAVTCSFWHGLTLLLGGQEARGAAWLARAARVSSAEPEEAPCRAYLDVPVALQAMNRYDPGLSLGMFKHVAAVGDLASDRDLATLGRLGQGQSLIALGEVARGTGVLDDVMLAVTNDEVSPLLAGLAYCAVIIACQQAFDLRRAHQWTEALSTWCSTQQGIRPYRGQCLAHRAQVLQFRGRWTAALAAARAACEHLSDQPGDPVQGMAHYQLGEVLRQLGRFGEAEEAYHQASRWGHPVQPGLALLRFSEGRVPDALKALGRLAEEELLPAEQVAVLAAYIDVAGAAAEPATARAALDRLTGIARPFASPQLAATCDQARGLVLLAEGDPGGAALALQAAKSAWVALEAPDEAARSAMHLGAALDRLGDHDSATIEWKFAESRFNESGLVADLHRLDHLTGGAGAGADDQAGLTARELEVLAHVTTGATNRQIARRLGLSEHTVRRHLQNIFAKLDVTSRVAATTWAHEHHVPPAPA